MTSDIFNEGRMYAETMIAFGATEPVDDPLSGEWATGPDLTEICNRHGIKGHGLDRDDVADEWEAGYFSAAWPYRLED